MAGIEIFFTTFGTNTGKRCLSIQFAEMGERGNLIGSQRGERF